MSGRTFVVFMALLAVIGLLAFGLIREGRAGLAVGDEAPVASLPVLAGEAADGDGGTQAARRPSGFTLASPASIADLRGRWVLVNVWASWCIPCEDEAPDLVALQRKHGGPAFTVLGVNTRDTTRDALEFEREFELNYPSLRDGDGRYADELGTSGVPETILVDPEGRVAYLRRGQVDAAILEANVVPLIAGEGQAATADRPAPTQAE